MKLKPSRARRRRDPRGAGPRPRAAAASRGAGRQARRPGIPFRRRVGARLPSIRRADRRRRRGRHRGGAGGAAERAVDARHRGRLGRRALHGRRRSARHLDDAARRERPGRRHRCAAQARSSACRPSSAHRSPPRIGGRLEATVVEREVRVRVGDPGLALPGRAGRHALRREAARRELDAEVDGLPRDRTTSASRPRLLAVGDVIPDGAAARRPARRPRSTRRSSAPTSRALERAARRRVRLPPRRERGGLGGRARGLRHRPAGDRDARPTHRLDRQIAAVRTLFAAHPEDEVGWVDARNPGKVYFRAKG